MTTKMHWLSVVVLIVVALSMPQRCVAQPISPAQIAHANRKYSHEPDVAVVVRAAIRHARLQPGRAHAVASRARVSGLMPQLRLNARRWLGRDLSELQSRTNDRVNLSTDDQLGLEASMSFPLDRLVFSPHEVALLRQERIRADDRQLLIQSVVQIYFERRRLQLERDLLHATDVKHHLRIAELGALLDALTGGVFYRHIRAHRRRSR